ncbi:DegT/DnrJ/EryC1/StrS family aminotransferase [Bradyrhizobium quebecense]|uniref:DegT/DnrJ/EryC1/StrS family aminotransferase n=2 Tax=Bradyrhizobium quebecense TaxID=2748629 RepID=A0A973WJX1_9BRAD|nr:DegT/DnrJ/EryC1/StrS family aminotransferase [Bradyrhizobium quebecense]UGA48292.1 DegT/DnrJ/EryC1/StrS family aminotransferase [Bradyrhizobium quebecense]UGY04450.1 DegT/DnrJ/EryC1/StrS family aminotransferase [Bradyrhizobium quebecense]
MNITEPSFDEAEIALLRECLDSKWVTQGPLTERFERLIAEKQDVKHALACTSCTAALHLATMALKLGPGDEVIVPAFTWVTSAHSAEYVGAKPVFVDVDLSTYNIDPEKLKAAITPRTKAIVAVHLFGLAAPMDEIKAIAEPRGIAIIEDAACAIGTTYKGKPVGAIGDIGCFSFHPRKAVTTGEGGAVTTNRDDLAARVRSQRNHGATGAPDPSIEPPGPWTMATFGNLGFNLRLSDIQAAVGVAQMGKLDRLLAERRRLGRRYSDLLSDVNSIGLPSGGDVDGHTYQSYVIRVLDGGRKHRNDIMRALAQENIQTRPGTHAVHRLEYYSKKYGLTAGQFPNAASAEDTTITLPIFPGMTEDDQRKVVQIVRAMG